MATSAARTEDVRWDLSDLAGSAEEARTEWGRLVERATAFGSRYRGRVAELDAAGVRALLDEADELAQSVSRLQVYTHLRLSADAADPEANDLATVSRERAADVESALVFVDLEWIALDDARAETLLAAEHVAAYAHKLRVLRDQKPYVLSEPEERALNARRPTVSAWQALHDREVATLETPFDAGDGERPHTVSMLLSYLYRPEREVRQGALATLLSALDPRADVLAACYDALVGDRLGMDRLRGFSNPMQPTNMNNELEDETVETMLRVTLENVDVAQRWFRTKAQLLGFDRLELADQYAPIGEARAFTWADAVETVDSSFARFSPRFAEIARAALETGHVDAPPRPGKATGAFCTDVSRSVPPYVMLNFTERLRDVNTIAHEFGHLVHDVLALEEQTWRSHRTGIPISEVPSTFAQSLADDYLLESESDAQTRAVLAADRLETAFAAVFRQTVLARFEQRAYRLRMEGRALTADRLSELWQEEQARYYGDAIVIPNGYGVGWSYITHFIHVRFYTYAYSFAQLVALLLHRRYREDPEAFVPRYLDFLRAGGSESPAQLLRPFGVDLQSDETWQQAFAELERLRVEAETLAAAALG
jgi:oligoendopeptidase F